MNLIKLLSLGCVLPFAFSGPLKASEDGKTPQNFEQNMFSPDFNLLTPLVDEDGGEENFLQGPISKEDAISNFATNSGKENQFIVSDGNGLFEDLSSMANGDENMINEPDSSESQRDSCYFGKNLHQPNSNFFCKGPCEEVLLRKCLNQLKEHGESISNLKMSDEKINVSFLTLTKCRDSDFAEVRKLGGNVSNNTITIEKNYQKFLNAFNLLQTQIIKKQEDLKKNVEDQTQTALKECEETTKEQLEESKSQFTNLITAINATVGIDPTQLNDQGIPLINNNHISSLQKEVADLQIHYKDFSSYLGNLSCLENLQSFINLDVSFASKKPMTLEKTMNFLAQFIKKNLDRLDEQFLHVTTNLEGLTDVNQKYGKEIRDLQEILQPIQDALEGITKDALLKLKDLKQDVEETVEGAINSDAFQKSINDKVSIFSERVIALKTQEANKALSNEVEKLSKGQVGYSAELEKHGTSIQILSKQSLDFDKKLSETSSKVDVLNQNFENHQESSKETFSTLSENLETLEGQYKELQILIRGYEFEENLDDETKEEEGEKPKTLMERLTMFEEDLVKIHEQIEKEINVSKAALTTVQEKFEKDIEEKIEALKNGVEKNCSDHFEETQTKVTFLENSLETFQEQVSQESEKTAFNIQKIEETAETVAETITLLQDKVNNSIPSKLEGVESQVNSAKDAIQKLDDSTKNQINALDGRINIQEEGVKTLTDDFNLFKSSVEANNTATATNLNSLSSEIELFKKETSENYASLETNLTQGGKEMLEKEVYLNGISRIDTLESQLSELVFIITVLEDKNAALDRKNAWYETRLKSLETVANIPVPPAPESGNGGR